MFNWNDQEQVGVLLWDKHKINEDHILPRPTKEGNTLLTFGERSKKQRCEYATNIMRSTVETSRAKRDFLDCTMEKRSGCSSQDCDDSNLRMDEWSDLPYLCSALNDGFNGGSDQGSAVTELMNDLADASDLYSGVGIMTRYNNSSECFLNKGLSSLSKPCSLLNGDAMQLDGEPEPFGHDDKGSDSFLDYEWANIEDLDDLDKIFKNNDFFDVNEKIYNAVDITSNTSWFIPVPGVPTSMEQTSDIGTPYHQLGEDSDANVNSLLSKKADWKNQTWRAQEAEIGKGISFQGLNCFYSSENQPVSSSEMQDSNVNPLHIIQSPPLGQECLSKNQTQESTPEVSYLEEQYQSQLMSSSINGQSVEEAIYHQLQYTMRKLNERVRLNIRDSLFRLARSAMERLNDSDRSCTVKNKDEYEISMDEESNNHDRSSSMLDFERVTNPIDRIVAHLLFHSSSGSFSLPIGDGNVPMATSMCTW